jgi:DNA-binding NarL/FixJ family response regulator
MLLKNQNEKVIRIIMLDAEEKLLEAVKNYFSLKNIHIITATVSDIAWIELEKTLPDCIVVDIVMPNNDSYNFIENLKNNNSFKNIPFILLTAKGLTEDRIFGYKLGCSAYISKPFDPEELEYIIKSIVLRNDKLLESMRKNYVLAKEIKLNILKKYIQSIESKLRFSLTSQEQFVLSQILLGNTTHHIAFSLKVSKRNIEKYITRLLDKTQTKNTVELKSLLWSIKNQRANDGNRTRE